MQYGPIHHFQSGVAVPVASLRSERGCGTGEFLDLPALGRWCVDAGLDLIQILPLNDSGTDPSPYGALSAFALHPLYARLSAIEGADAIADRITVARRRLESHRLRYHEVLKEKLDILRILHAVSEPSHLDEWISNNLWVKPYAVFRGRKHHYGESPWWEWPDHQKPDDAMVQELWQSDPQARFHTWVQYELERQLREASDSLGAMGVRLKGDLPILLNADSADVWYQRQYFDLDWKAGAPPDMFSDRGQNWGFPCYRWGALADEDYDWWRDRLRQASKFYHAYRIDHVLGFFRIWRIPASEQTGMLGQYDPAIPIQGDELRTMGFTDAGIQRLCRPDGGDLTEAAALADADEREQDQALTRVWNRVLVRVPEVPEGYRPRWQCEKTPMFHSLPDAQRQALRHRLTHDEASQQDLWASTGRARLRALLESSEMLACAEDLGAVPECVPRVLEELGILGLRVERWTRDWSASGQPFLDPHLAPRLIVWTPSGHDTSTLRGWWQENPDDREQLAIALGLESAPETMTVEIARRALERTFTTNALLCVVALQDLLALEPTDTDPSDERVNVPGTAPEQNWRYRMPRTLEELGEDASWTARVAALTTARRARPLD